MTIRRTVVGKNVEALEGPKLKGLRFGTLSIDEQGIHFNASIMMVPGYAWHLPWEEVADVQLGSDSALRWSNVLPMKVAHAATHITIVDTEGRQHGFVAPRVAHERVHNAFLPSMARWNRGTGPRQA